MHAVFAKLALKYPTKVESSFSYRIKQANEYNGNWIKIKHDGKQGILGYSEKIG